MFKYFIVSDIHSQYNMLIKALNDKGFDVRNENHILVIAGDILDRGNEGKQLIKYLESLISKDKVIGVLGNHDIFIRDIINGYWSKEKVIWNIRKNGFLKTIQIAYDKPFDIDEIPNEILEEVRDTFLETYPIFCDWLDELPRMLMFENHVIVHGFLDFSIPDWKDTTERFAVWERGFNMDVPKSFKKHIIIGHTPNYHIDKQDDTIYENKKIMIDGGAAMGHQINVFVLTEEEI